MRKFYLLISTCIFLTHSGIYGQQHTFQEKLNKKQFHEIIEEVGPATIDSLNSNTLYIIGQAYEGMLKYRQAYHIYQKCLEKDSLDIDLLNTLGRTATNLGRGNEAKYYFNRVIESDSTNFYANYQLARLYFQLGDYESAAAQYHYLEESDPENPAILKNLGDCYIRMENPVIGSSYYYMAYDNNKENPGLASTLINTYLRMGGDFIPEAIIICDTALMYNPDNSILISNKAMSLYMNKNYADADTLYTALIEKGDSTFTTLLYGGASRYYGGYPMNAIEPLEAAYKKDSTSVDVCLLLGAALGKTYDRKRAYELLNQAEENMQPSPIWVNRLTLFRAETYQRDGNYPEASRLFYQLWKENTTRLDYLHKLVLTHSVSNLKQYKSENEKQKGLYLNILYIREYLKTGEDPIHLYTQKRILKLFYEDMFFQGIKELTGLAPDGTKHKITADEIKGYLDHIPEPKRE